jgi:hypothetical protein
MRRKITGVILLSLVFINTLIPQQQAYAEVCPVYDFQSLFFEEYSGTKWDNRNGIRNITWSANTSVIHDESVTRSLTLEESEWVRSAFQSWDDALDSVKFIEYPQGADAEIVIGYVALTSATNQPRATGYWNAWWRNGWRYKATIKLKVSNTSWFSVKNQFIHAVQHELGNVLGLGDITPTSQFTSTQEDSWQPPYGVIPLSEFDTGMIRQLYGESTCPSTFPNASARAAAELKAKQEAEAEAAADKFAADLKAKEEAEAKAAADAAVLKLQLEEFNEVSAAYNEMMKKILEMKLMFPFTSSLLGMETKMKNLPITLGEDQTTARTNISNVNKWLDTNKKIWEKTQKMVITCVKGKLTKKVTAVKPKCPPGFKMKK